MKQVSIRITAVLMSVLMALSFIPSAFAVDYHSKATFFSWLASQGGIFQGVVGSIFPSGCLVSPDGLHHASSVVSNNGDGTFTCNCTACGSNFVITEQQMQSAYDDYVDTLPASGIGSDGALYVTIPHSYMDIGYGSHRYYCEHYSGDMSSNYSHPLSDYYNTSFDCHSLSLTVLPDSGSTGFQFYNAILHFSLNAPVSGYYSRIVSPFARGSLRVYDSSYDRSSDWSVSSSTFYSVGSDISTTLSFTYNNSSTTVQLIRAQFYAPIYRVVPLDGLLDPSSDIIYNTNTRTGSITAGQLGLVNNSGDINILDHGSIFDELGGIYYSPTTNTDSSVTSWNYDYSDRSYTLTLESGDTVTVTYGDEYITVVEGDTITNVYYIINGTGDDTGSGGGSGGGDTHQHSYTSRVTREPSCTVPGVMTYTCSVDGYSYTESIPAKGHNWEVKSSVQTEYDDDGNLVQEGYTIYKCSVCGEEYKATDGTSPPAGGGSSGSIGGTSGVFSGIFGLFWDFCSFMLDLFTDFIVGGIGGFLAAIADVGSGFFGILNPVGWFS